MPSGRWRPGNWGLASRVAAAAAILLVMLLAIVVVSYRQALDERRDAEVANAVSTGRAVAGIIDGFATDLESSLLAIAIAVGEHDGPIDQESVGTYLRTLAGHYQILRAIFVTDLRGRVVAADTGVGVGTELRDRPYMQPLFAGATSVWGPGVAGLESGEVTATYGRAITGRDGETVGYLVAAFYPRRLSERLVGRVAEDADITVIDRTGAILFSSRRPDIAPEDRDLSGSGRVQAALAGSVTEVDGSTRLFDAPRFGVVAPVPSAGWAVAYTRPLGTLEAALFRAFVAQAVQIGGAVLLVGALLTLATRRIVRPLHELADTASAVARGERPPVPPASGTAEVRQLAEAMGTMSAAVAEREDALRRESERRHALADASRAFAEVGLDLDRELATVARRVAETVGDGCAVLLLSEEDEQTLIPVAMHHGSPEQLERARAILNLRPLVAGEGLIGEAMKAGAPRVVRELPLQDLPHGIDPELRAQLEHFELWSMVSTPLTVHGRAIGVLVAWRGPGVEPYDDADVDLLTQIADRAALGIENARLYREAAQHATAVERAMRALEESVALLAHDLRNPLTTISGVAQSVRRQVRRGRELEPERMIADMTAVESAVTRALREIQEALDLAQAQVGKPLTVERHPVALVGMLRAIAEECQRQTDTHEITVEHDEPELVGEWDPARLERAFVNLMDNAIKYSPDGGPVTTTVRRIRHDGGDWAVVSVRDHGIGIPAPALYRIFERFFRAENAADRFTGTGLGLSGVRYIIEAHGGSVEVESVEGEGSTFVVRLPVAPQEPGVVE